MSTPTTGGSEPRLVSELCIEIDPEMRRQHDLSRSRLPRPTSAAADPLSSTTSRPSPLLSCPTSAVTSPPPSAAASRATSPPLPSTNSRSPPLLPPPPPASTSRSPPLLSSPPPAAASTTHPAPLLSPPPPTAASTTRPRQLFTDIDGVSRRLADVAVEGRSYSYSCLEPPPCEDTEQAVRIEAPPPPRPFPPVSSLMPTRLLIKYFLRVDADGLFHTYPHRGGPFKSLKQAQDAIDSHHTNLCKFKYMGDLSEEDIHVWQTLYWPNGTRMNSKQALDVMMNRRPKWDVLNALLDKYNEDHHLFGDFAYELKEIVSYKPHFQGKNSPYKCRSFSHLNLIVKSGSSAVGDLFFAEITCMKDGELEEYVLSCICVVTPEANGECCGCGDDVKHPTGVEYKKRDKLPVRRNGCRRTSEELFNEFIVVCDEDCLDAEEARVRREFRMSKRGDGQGMRGRYVIPAKR